MYSTVRSARPSASLLFWGILIAGALTKMLLSPKWLVPGLAWISPTLLLYYYRHASTRFRTAWFFVFLVMAQLLSSYAVVPFPLPVLAIVSILNVAKTWLVYAIDRQVCRKHNTFLTTLVFPALYVSKEYFDMHFSGGAWWSIANTQYGFSSLAQLASITGLLGISFMIYWFASVLVWSIERYRRNEQWRAGALIYTAVFTAVMAFGAIRYYGNPADGGTKVPVAGVNVPNIGILESLYRDVTGKIVHVDPRSAPSSPRLQQINTALIPFIEQPDPEKFLLTYKAIRTLHDSLFSLSQKAADNGARLIEWPEGNAIMPTAMQPDFMARGLSFAARNHVYLLMAMAVFEPGKITPDRLFLENKTILVGPDGKILNVFHKNHPVPFAEKSKPGDGTIPSVNTELGRLSVSICYDADIPDDMRQLGRQKADVLLLPSGDWYAIAPYHSYMGMFRGIENGCTVIREANGGLSLATDYRGRESVSFDYFSQGEKLWLANVPFHHVETVYNRTGDWLPYGCLLISLYVVGNLVFSAVKTKRSGAKHLNAIKVGMSMPGKQPLER